LAPDDSVDTYFNLMRGYRYDVLFCDFHAKSLSRSAYDQAWAVML
jgi:hypothetical protein